MGMKKYNCNSKTTKNGTTIPAQWLPRWYKISHDDCWFDHVDPNRRHEFIQLYPLLEGSNYEQHLKTLKTERLLNGI